MQKARRRKVENRQELERLKVQLNIELGKDEPNWNSVDESMIRMKTVFNHTHFINSTEKEACREWIDSTQNNSSQIRKEKARLQLGFLLSHLSDLKGAIHSVQTSKIVNQTTTSYAWTKVRKVRDFLKHTHFASAACREMGLRDFHRLVNELKTYEQDELRKPSPQRFFTLYQIKRLAEQARPPVVDHQSTPNHADTNNQASCDLSFQSAMSILGERRQALESCSSSSSEAWNLYDFHKFLMLNQHKADTFRLLLGVQKDLHLAWDDWLGQWRRLYAARLNELRPRKRNFLDLCQLEYDNLYAQLARRDAHRMELEEKKQSAEDPEFRKAVIEWLSDEKKRIAKLRLEIRAMKEGRTKTTLSKTK